jgi:PAS domain S-box-containing protein
MRNKYFDKTILVTLPVSVAIFALDFLARWGLGGWMLYFLPLIFTTRSKRLFYPIFYSCCCAIFMGIVLFTSPALSSQEWRLAAGARIAGAFLLWSTALLLVQRKRAELAQRESEERFASFMDHSTTLAWMKDSELKYIYINRPFERFFNTTLEQIKGKQDFDLMPAAAARELREHDSRVLSSGQSLETNETVPSPDGKPRHWIVYKFLFKDSAERKFVGGIAADVTERQQMNEALRNSEARFRSVWDSSVDGMRLTDESGTIIAVNKAYCKLSGMASTELVGQPLSVTYDCDAVEVMKVYRERFVSRTIPALLERSVSFRTGRTLDVEFANSIIELEGQPPLCLGIFRDISARKQHEKQRLALERKLLDSQKLESLGVLAGGIAHDFNNLLTGVLGNAGLCLMQTPEQSPIRAQLLSIEKICVQAADLCKQMLAYSGRGHFVIQKLNLNILVEEMTQLLRISIAKKVVMKFDLATNLPPIEADPAQIRQILMNLILNASEAIGENSGVISIRTGVMRADRVYLSESYLAPDLPEGDYVYLEVADSGCGMNAAVKAKIFDPFFTTKFTGRGLGLAAVLGIVRGHRGALKVFSEINKGSTFKLLLPCAEFASPKANSQNRSDNIWRGTGTILVIDDEDSVRTIAARMLELFGFSVLLAADGRQGVESFRNHQNKIAAIILDMTMPYLSGEEVFQELRSIHADAKILLVSGYNEQDAMDRFAGKGLNGFLQKPFRPDELRDKLKAILTSEEASAQ